MPWLRTVMALALLAGAVPAVHAEGDAEDGEDAAEHDDDYNALSADDAADPKNSRRMRAANVRVA